jgi:hypothetical protein
MPEAAMSQIHRQSYDWYEDADALVAPRTSPAAIPVVPISMEVVSWWMGVLAFSCLWMIESWTRASSGQGAVGDIAEGVWTLLLSLGICYGIYKFSRSQPKPFAHILSILSAAILLLNHATGT